MPGTIWYRDDFDVTPVVERLREAMSGFGTDEATVIDIMCNHSMDQRLEIAQAYKTAYGKDLIEDIKDELCGDFEETVLALLTHPRKLDVQELKDAMSGAGTDEKTIIEILCTKNNQEIEEIKANYNEEYGSDLESDLCGETSGYFERLLVSILAAGRENEDWYCDEAKAEEDAQKFYDAGEARWGTEEAELNAILCLRSYCQLLGTFRKFEDIAGKTIEESIEEECSGDLQTGYLALVKSIKDKPGFFADRIKECVQGFGTNDSHLIRILVSRSEIDLDDIAQAYEEKYETPLVDEIESECGGDYKRLLVAIVKKHD